MKILLTGRWNPSEILTGPEKCTKRLADALGRRGHAVHLLDYFHSWDRFGLREKSFGYRRRTEGHVTVHTCGVLRMPSVLHEVQPQVIHSAAFERYEFVIIGAARLTGVPFIATVHGLLAYEHALPSHHIAAFVRTKDLSVERVRIGNARLIAFPSERTAALGARRYAIDPRAVRIIDHGVDEEFAHAGSTRADRPGNDVRILFVGDPRREEKGFDVLERALRRASIPWRLTVIAPIGSWSPPDSWVDRVSLPGLRTTRELAEVMRVNDIIVAPSRYDPFHLASAEAMAAGAVSVVSDACGIARHIRHRENGFIVPVDNAESLAVTLDELGKDRALLKRVGAEATRIAAVLSWDRSAAQFERMYEEVSGGNAGKND